MGGDTMKINEINKQIVINRLIKTVKEYYGIQKTNKERKE